MSHHTQREAYGAYVDRLNRFPQGAPPSDTLYQILSVLVSRDEAAQLAALPIRPFTAAPAIPPKTCSRPLCWVWTALPWAC